MSLSDMTKYRKKPVVVEAVQWDGDNLREVINFTGWHPSASQKWTWAEYESVVTKDGLKIFTLEGSHMASVGDWIIKGVAGELYPCKPDIFTATYEPVAIRALSEQPSEQRRPEDDFQTGDPHPCDMTAQEREKLFAHPPSPQPQGECICPKCGLRHGGSRVDEPGF